MCSGLCNVGLLNDSGCRFGTQRQRLEDVEGLMARGYSDYCDSGSDVENRVTPIKTRLLKEGQSSDSDTILEILKSIVLYFMMKEYTSVPLYRRHMCGVQVNMCAVQVRV